MLVHTADVFTTIDSIIETILNLPGNSKVTGDREVFLLSAPPHGGKTYLSLKIKEILRNHDTRTTLVQHDWWNMGLNRTPSDGRVTISQDKDVKGFLRAIHELLSTGVIRPPKYDSLNRVHIKGGGGPVFFKEGEILILEGSVVLALKELREISSLNIYVDVPESIRLERIRQCCLGFKGMSQEETKKRLKRKGAAPIARWSARFADIIWRPDPASLPSVVRCDHK